MFRKALKSSATCSTTLRQTTVSACSFKRIEVRRICEVTDTCLEIRPAREAILQPVKMISIYIRRYIVH